MGNFGFQFFVDGIIIRLSFAVFLDDITGLADTMSLFHGSKLYLILGYNISL